MTDTPESVGGITHTIGSINNPQSPHWLVCENPAKPLDWWATWHAHACPTCLELAEALVVARGDEDNVQWLVTHLRNPDEAPR